MSEYSARTVRIPATLNVASLNHHIDQTMRGAILATVVAEVLFVSLYLGGRRVLFVFEEYASTPMLTETAFYIGLLIYAIIGILSLNTAVGVWRVGRSINKRLEEAVEAQKASEVAKAAKAIAESESAFAAAPQEDVEIEKDADGHPTVRRRKV